MKRFFLLLLIFSIQLCVVNAQSDEAEQLTNQATDLFKQGKLDEAIPMAEKAVSILKKAPQKDYLRLAAGLTNLGVLEKEKGIRLFKGLLGTKGKARQKDLDAFYDYESNAESHLQEVIDIHEKHLKSATSNLAMALSELAWIKGNYLPRRTSIESAEKRLSDAESLYFQSLVLKEKIYSPTNDLTQRTLLEFAEF